jgi:hypothetical protein
MMYASGDGVSRDDATAVRCWELAAAQGDAKGQFFLGIRAFLDFNTIRLVTCLVVNDVPCRNHVRRRSRRGQR